MKKLFAILLVTALTSCGVSSSSEPAEAREQSAALEPPKSNTDYKNIIGKPIKIGNIEVAQYDFPDGRMDWNDAKKACADLGEGWKLPSKDELNTLYQNSYEIGGFKNSSYWSSTQLDVNGAWYQFFFDGDQNYNGKYATEYVRAIRALEQSAALEPPESNTDYKNIIGKPIKIGNIEVAQYNFPKKMDWNDAKKACADLGEGWKLTSKDELNYLYQNRVAIGGFKDGPHWSSTETSSNFAWYQLFNSGFQSYDSKDYAGYVRAVRAF